MNGATSGSGGRGAAPGQEGKVPATSSAVRHGRLRHPPGWWRAVAAIGLLAAGTATGLLVAVAGSSPAYATATAADAPVREKVAEPATVTDVTQAQENFDASGTVQTVDVQVGDSVYADETLADLSYTSTETALQGDRFAYSEDQTQVTADESGQTLLSAEGAVTADQTAVTVDGAAAAQAQVELATVEAQNTTALQHAQTSVNQAQQAWSGATTALSSAQAAISPAETAVQDTANQYAAAGCPSPPPGPMVDCTTLASAASKARSTLTADENAVSADQATVATDQHAVDQAQVGLLTTELQEQSVLNQATRNLSDAQQEMATAQSLLANAQVAVAQANGQVAVAVQDAMLKATQAQAQTQSQVENMRDRRLTAPISGTVEHIDIHRGMAVTGAPPSLTAADTPTHAGVQTTVAGGSVASAAGATGSSPAITIRSRGTFVAEASLNGQSATMVRVGDRVGLTVGGQPSSVPGTVSSVGVISTDSAGIPSVPVTIAISGRPPGVYSGVTAGVVVTLEQKPNVLSVPSDAVHANGSQTYVIELENGHKVDRDVRVGLVGASETQITSGLSAGTQVVLPGS